MVYEFEITSEEKEDFSRMIKIKEDQTFLELHEAIQSSVGYDSSQLASFYTLDARGMRNVEVSLFEMEDEDSDVETYVMDVTMIKEIINTKKKKLLYVYDFFGDRSFTISLIGTEDEEVVDYPVCTFCEGDAPIQVSEDEDDDFENEEEDRYDDEEEDFLDDDFYGNDDLDDEEDIFVGKKVSKAKVAPLKKVKKSSSFDDDRDPYMLDDDMDFDSDMHFENLDDYDDIL